jgi:peptidoglycan hydrolase-like protein with peptidoglycan-binding domain
VLGGSCGPGEVEIQAIADNYGQYVGDQVSVEGKTEKNVVSSNPRIYDTTGGAHIRSDTSRSFDGNQCLRVDGTVLPEREIPVTVDGVKVDIAIDAEVIEVL